MQDSWREGWQSNMTQIMKTTGDWVVIIFILSGAMISLFGSIGILRFPDYYNRNHASSKTTTLGVLLTLLGAFLYFLFETVLPIGG